MRCIKTGANVYITSHNHVRHGDLFVTDEGTYILRATKEIIQGTCRHGYLGYPDHIFEDNQDTIIFGLFATKD